MKYAGEESVQLEFKSQLPKNDQIIKTIIGFCNQHGGKLVLGVEDDRTIVGIPENEAIELMAYFEHAIFEATTPPIIPKIFLQRIANKVLVVIEVSQGMNKPYYRYAEGLAKGTYLRVGKHTLRASSDMIEELKWQSRGLSYENMPIYQADEGELARERIQYFLAHRRQKIHATLSREVMLSYKLLVEEHGRTYPSVAGVLLFGKRVQYWLPEAVIICSHFKGISGREAMATVDCEGCLFDQLEQAYHFVISRLHRAFSIKSLKRDEKLEIPEVAFREVLLNAIIHRNYHVRAPIKIAIYDDRVEVFSPGNFPTPFPSLRLGLTDARNMTISTLFREAKLVEKLGSGLNTLFESYHKWQLPEPKIIDGDGFVKCILPRENYDSGDIRDDDKAILILFEAASALAVSDIISALNMPRSTASRKLNMLVEKGALKAIGKGKATRYCRTLSTKRNRNE